LAISAVAAKLDLERTGAHVETSSLEIRKPDQEIVAQIDLVVNYLHNAEVDA
jgi:hypothetical protein